MSRSFITEILTKNYKIMCVINNTSYACYYNLDLLKIQLYLKLKLIFGNSFSSKSK